MDPSIQNQKNKPLVFEWPYANCPKIIILHGNLEMERGDDFTGV